MVDVRTPGALFDLTGRVAIVTGASSGLGERFARVLLAAGASVAAVARRASRLEALAEDEDGVLPVVADISDPRHIERIVPMALERFGQLDVRQPAVHVRDALNVQPVPLEFGENLAEVADVVLLALDTVAERTLAGQTLALGGNDYGNLTLTRDSMQRVWRHRWFDAAEALARDLKLAIRALLRVKGLAAIAVQGTALAADPVDRAAVVTTYADIAQATYQDALTAASGVRIQAKPARVQNRPGTMKAARQP